MTPENELLRSYARTGSEEAFTELVHRHVNLVYSTALRQVSGDAHLAQDVAQKVFTELARKAASLLGCTSLTGWLYTNAYFTANKVARTEHRRRQREEQFMREPIHDTATAADWEKLRPALDSVMHELKESDREAVLLRYFENRPFAEVGAKLSVNENTARMRVERALEKLRSLLAKRGITTGAALASIISANAVQTAPALLAGSLATTALSGAGTGAFSFFQTMNMTTLKLGLGALAIAGVIGALVVQLHAQRTLRAENESLSGQVAQLKVDNEQLSNQVTANADSLATQKDQSAELLRLRAEVTQLRAMKTAPTMAAAPATNNSPVKKRMEIVFEVKFVSIPTRTVPSFGAGWTTVGPNTSLLSDQQFAVVDAAIRNKDLDWVTAARITTSSGIEAISRMTDQVQVDGTNADVGETMDVLPYFSSDSSNVTLNLAATLNQLIGDPSNPGLFTTQMSNQVSVAPGQTVVLKGEIPAGAWMQRTDDKAVVPLAPDGPMNLLVFVTPTLINARGEPQTAMADVSRENLMEKMNEAKQGVLALVMFAEDNGKQYPTNLDDAARYMKNDFMKTVASNFDFLNPGSITNVAQPATTIVLKEKQAWQGPDGGWLKAYGFADGHAEIHKEPAGNFDEFEKEHTLAESGQ